MSWRHMQAAGLLPITRPPVKAVLLTLAHHANDFTGVCWPDLERIMLFTGLSRRGVQTALREIEELGLMSTVTGRNKRASTYSLTLEGVDPLAQSTTHGAPPAFHGAGGAPHGAGDAPQYTENRNRKDARAVVEDFDEAWRPSPEATTQAEKDFPNVDITIETNRFVDTNVANGQCPRNPTAAWRAWLGRGEQFAARDKAQGTGRRAGAGRGRDDRTAAPGLRALARRQVVVVDGTAPPRDR